MKIRQFEELKQLFWKSNLLKGKDKGYKGIRIALRISAILLGNQESLPEILQPVRNSKKFPGNHITFRVFKKV